MFRHLQPVVSSGVGLAMNTQLTTLLEAVRLMQEELLAHGAAKQKGVAIPQLTVAKLCDILGEPAVVEAIVHLSAAADGTDVAQTVKAPSWWGVWRH
jgi:hypothetical protein